MCCIFHRITMSYSIAFIVMNTHNKEPIDAFIAAKDVFLNSTNIDDAIFNFGKIKK